MTTATLKSIRCASCGHVAGTYTFAGETCALPRELPIAEIRKHSRTAQCSQCSARLALFELGATS